MRWLTALLTSIFLVLSLATARAAPPNPVTVVATGSSVAPGGDACIEVTFVVPPGKEIHLYRDMLDVRVADAGGLTVGELSFPVGETKPDPQFPSMEREQYEHDVVVLVPVKAPAAAGEYTATLETRFQACKGKELCWLPKSDTLSAKVSVAEGQPASVACGDAGAAKESAGAEEEAPFDPANLPKPSDVIKLTAGPQQGDTAVIQVALTRPWHINRSMLDVRLTDGPVQAGPFGAPEGVEVPDMFRSDLTEDFEITLPLSGPEGAHDIQAITNVQVCRESVCLAPTDLPALAMSVVLGRDAVAAPGPATPPAQASGSGFQSFDQANVLDEAGSQGWLGLVLFVFGAGFLVSLTPCVLPMVPITLGIIGAAAANEEEGSSRFRAVTLAATYVAGLALVYTGLMVFMALTGNIFGAWMQSRWVVGAIAVFFFAMGLAMFGLFDVAMPSSVQTRLNQYGGAGYGGAFVVGMVGALVAGPCSGPVIAALMALIAQQGEVVKGAVLGFVFSLGMGVIFLVAGAFSSTLLRPGMWMDTVKKSFGLVMWAGAVFFASPHLGPALTALVAGLMLVLTAVFAWPSADAGEGFWIERSRRSYSVLGGLVGIYLLFGLMVQEGFILPPMQLGGGAASAGSQQAAGVVFGDSEPAALAQARAERKPILLDFTADWCTACKEMEHLTYTDPAVIAQADKMVRVMVDMTDDADPENLRLKDKYGVPGLPFIVFMKPDGTVIKELTVTGYLKAEQFLPRMQAAVEAAAR